MADGFKFYNSAGSVELSTRHSWDPCACRQQKAPREFLKCRTKHPKKGSQIFMPNFSIPKFALFQFFHEFLCWRAPIPRDHLEQVLCARVGSQFLGWLCLSPCPSHLHPIPHHPLSSRIWGPALALIYEQYVGSGILQNSSQVSCTNPSVGHQ